MMESRMLQKLYNKQITLNYIGNYGGLSSPETEKNDR